jgi:uncharacterized coiled-coil protein SlyX
MEGILALMIPIVAIVVWSPVGKAVAERLRTTTSAIPSKDITHLEARLHALESRVMSQEDELQQLRSSVDFYDQLLPAQEESFQKIQAATKKGA